MRRSCVFPGDGRHTAAGQRQVGIPPHIARVRARRSSQGQGGLVCSACRAACRVGLAIRSVLSDGLLPTRSGETCWPERHVNRRWNNVLQSERISPCNWIAWRRTGCLCTIWPSNVVLRCDGEGVDVRIIDYGRDFCEMNELSCGHEVDVNTPVLNMVNKLTLGDKQLMQHIIFAAMLLQLASTTTRHIYEHRFDNRMSRDLRTQINPTVPLASRLSKACKGRNIRILKEVLRSDQVRSVLQHYHGRRNGGTRRTLQFATGDVC